MKDYECKPNTPSTALWLINKCYADPNFKDDPSGDMPLHMAAKRCTYDVVKTLLDAGADPKLKDKKGRTALDYAQDRDEPDEKVIEALS